eukprot:1185095-Prorocentrum_minimum.AAC.2
MFASMMERENPCAATERRGYIGWLISGCGCWEGPIFAEPVDVVNSGAADYYAVISRPMDFSTIRKNLRSEYAKPSEFFNDVQQVRVDRCISFSGSLVCFR